MLECTSVGLVDVAAKEELHLQLRRLFKVVPEAKRAVWSQRSSSKGIHHLEVVEAEGAALSAKVEDQVLAAKGDGRTFEKLFRAARGPHGALGSPRGEELLKNFLKNF